MFWNLVKNAYFKQTSFRLTYLNLFNFTEYLKRLFKNKESKKKISIRPRWIVETHSESNTLNSKHQELNYSTPLIKLFQQYEDPFRLQFFAAFRGTHIKERKLKCLLEKSFLKNNLFFNNKKHWAFFPQRRRRFGSDQSGFVLFIIQKILSSV